MPEVNPEPQPQAEDEQAAELPERFALSIVNQSPVNQVVDTNFLANHAQTSAVADQTVPIQQTS